MADSGTSFAITITTGTAVYITTSAVLPTTGTNVGLGASYAYITLETSNVRYTYSPGTVPTTAKGHLMFTTGQRELRGLANILNFAAICTSAGLQATAVVTLGF